ncbi:MAG: phosphoenolpyruvate carboxylase [Proteobacteria bacterium]|nr:phosphoenolpyruvate carboxylase [Pseudomonadota bacterium]
MYRQNIQFPAKDAPLREDVHALGALVGEILLEQCGRERFDLVEGDRVAAIQRREGVAGGEAELLARTRDRQPREARDLVRAFSTWFQVVNLAEKVHRIRRRREYLNNSAQPQPGGLDDALTRLARDGCSLPDVSALLGRLCIYPVFTAHPTESARRTILRKQQQIAELMLDRLDPTMTPGERRASWEQIRTELTSGWQTEEHPRERLTVADEREHVLFFLAEILYRIVPGFYEELADSLGSAYGTTVTPRSLPRVLRFGTWVGGDMDGAPDVHAKTIRESLQRQQLVIVNAYFIEVQRLGERLSQSASRVAVSRALQSRIDEYAALLPAAQQGAPARHDRMPYRQFCAQLATRLRNTYDGRPHHYESAGQFLGDVRLMADSLAANNGTRAGLFYVERLLRRVDTFGFHLATLDVRQHADVHRAVVAQGLGDPEFALRPAEARLARLRTALERDEGPSHPLDAVGRRTLAVFEQLMHGRHRHGKDAIGDYVVSGAQGPDDVLAVLLLARWAEMVDKRVGEVPLDVAPLFESVDTLHGSAATLAALLAEPVYRRHVAARGDRQVAMIGYADTNKESGFAASRWALHRAQAALAAAAAEAGVSLTVFHGRGSSTGRGTNRIETILQSAPVGSFHGVLRVTEQGEVINQSYALRPIAMRSLEQALGGALQVLAGRPARPAPEPIFAEAFEAVAAASRGAYRALVHESEGFYEYFRDATPIDVIERMQIGSRPATRAGCRGIESLRAVPWAFAWSQSRHLLPAWYGIGTGLDGVAATHGAAVLERMLAHWPFFSRLLDEIEFGLAVADMDIAGWYAELAPAERRHHFTAVRTEYERTRDWVLRLRGGRRLLDGEPGIQRAMKLRNPYVDPMHLMQIDLLRRWRAGGRQDFDLQESLIASIAGISQGLQATG